MLQVERERSPRQARHLALGGEVEGRDAERGAEEERQIDHQHLAHAVGGAQDEVGQQQQREQEQQRIGEVVGQVEEGLGLLREGRVRPQDARQELARDLDRALGPAELLRLEGRHLDGQLGRRGDLGQVDEAPAAQLRPVRQIHVLGQGVVVPAAGVDDGRAPPQPGGAVEVEEAAGAVAAGVLHDEVAVEHQGLRLGQRREVAVDVLPAALHHRDLGVEEVVHGALQDVGVGHEVGVEDEHQLALGGAQAVLQGAGLEAGAIGAMHVLDVEVGLRAG